MIFDAIQEWFQELLIDGIISNLTGMFDTLNTKVGEIAGEVGMTPSAWNSGIFNMVRNLSETVIVPIASIVLTFVMCYELTILFPLIHTFKSGNIGLRCPRTLCQFPPGHANRLTALDFIADDLVLRAKRIIFLIDFGTPLKDFSLKFVIVIRKISIKFLY